MQAPTESRVIVLEVLEVLRETADAVSLVLGRAAGGRPLSYRPGQFLTLRIPTDDGGAVARCYSLSSSPYGSEKPKITIKRVPDGFASGWLWSQAHVGMRIAALPPAGAFVPESFDADFLLIAAGSGITPIISILKAAILRGRGHIALVYSSHAESAVIFAEELAALAARHPERLVILPWLTREMGRMTRGRLQRVTVPYRSYTSFICGPDGFMRAAREALQANGVPPERTHVESFKSLSANPFDPLPYLVRAKEGGGAVRVEIELQGKTHDLPWPAGMTLLELMLSHGLDVPYLCSEGVCGTCLCRVERGKVRMLLDEASSAADGIPGYTLACQSLHTGVDTKVVF